jgi:hypothetical protein
MAARTATIAALRHKLAEAQGWHALRYSQGHASHEIISTGIPALNALLPAGGLRQGTLCEWLAEEGTLAATLALHAVREAIRSEEENAGAKVWALIDEAGDFYPPAAAGWGIDLDRLLLVRPADARQAAWAVEQCLRCPGVAVTWCKAVAPLCGTKLLPRSKVAVSLREMRPKVAVSLRETQLLRRWQLAAERGGGIGLLFRSLAARHEPSWADVRFWVEPLAVGPQLKNESRAGGRVRVELLSCRGGFGGGAVELEVLHETGVVRVAGPVADPAARPAAAGA